MSATKYAIYIPSKDRAATQYTAEALSADNVDFSIVVEPCDVDAYTAAGWGEHLLVLPFENLGLGPIPARNFIRDHAEASGATRHWQLDDNIKGFKRLVRSQRISCRADIALRVAEDFTDRYTNIGLTGLQYAMFAIPGAVTAPFFLNNFVYSCVLINHALPCRWRGRYNEDADLCLQAIANGFCNVTINVFLQDKIKTMTLKGGNTADYDPSIDGRLKMARELERMWPGVVTVSRRFKRPQHVIAKNWAPFRALKLQLRDDIDLSQFERVDEYGLVLKKVKQSAHINDELLADIAQFEPAR